MGASGDWKATYTPDVHKRLIDIFHVARGQI
jgi:hypothetical protein